MTRARFGSLLIRKYMLSSFTAVSRMTSSTYMYACLAVIPGEKPMFSMRSDPLFQSIMRAVQNPMQDKPGKPLDPFTM